MPLRFGAHWRYSSVESRSNFANELVSSGSVVADTTQADEDGLEKGIQRVHVVFGLKTMQLKEGHVDNSLV